MDAASFEVAWYNKTLSMRECPEDQIAATRSFLLTREGAVRQRVVQAFEPGFHLAEARLVMQGSCLDLASPSPDTTGDPIHDLLPHQEYLLAFVVPGLIIISMLLLAILIACILHRKRKAGKLDMFKTEALPPRIPVIMQVLKKTLVQKTDNKNLGRVYAPTVANCCVGCPELHC